MTIPTLVLCPVYNNNNQKLWQAAVNRNWGVERLLTYRVPKELRDLEEPVLYIQALFAPSIGKAFGIKLVEPPDDWLPNLPWEFRKRDVYLTILGDARKLDVPKFVKPPNDKSFKASVCQGKDLPLGEDDQPVLVAEPTKWFREFRCFLLENQIQTVSRYFQDGKLCFTPPSDEEMAVITDLVAQVTATVAVPRTVVIDVGETERGWAVVELNAAWGSGIYECNPYAVLDVLRETMREKIISAIDSPR